MTQKETITYYLKNLEYRKALAFAKEIKRKKNKIVGLELIIHQLLETNDLSQALEVAQLLPDERKQASILKTIQQKALKAKKLQVAYQAAESIQIPRSQSAALKSLADYYLQKADTKQALKIAVEIKTLKTQTGLLKGMSERLLEHNLPEALLAAERIKDVPVKLALLEKLTRQIIQQHSVEKAIDAIVHFKDALSKVWLWTIVSEAIPEKKSRTLLNNAQKSVDGLSNNYEQSLAMAQVAFYMVKSFGSDTKVEKLQKAALTKAKKIWEDVEKLHALKHLAAICIKIDSWNQAIEIVQNHIDRADVTSFLSQLTKQLKEEKYQQEAAQLQKETQAILQRVNRSQKVKKLIKVSNEKPSSSNYYYYYGYDDDNKFYTMTDNEDGTFTVEYGRIGEDYSDTYSYPIQDWAKKYKEKLRKGYKDVTYMYEQSNETEQPIHHAPIEQSGIAQLVKELQNFAQQSVIENYTVTAQNVTLTQLEEAQGLVDDISLLVELIPQGKNPRKKIDDLLLKLFTVIPRKMNLVEDYLTQFLNDEQDVRKRVVEEQATLDVMRGEVLTHKNTKENNQHLTLLDAMGIKIETAELDDIMAIRQLMGNQYFDDYFQKAYKVTNFKTQKVFDHKVENTPNRRTKLLWHGSRNENWWSILKTGLVLRPSNAVITGKMFGYGLYFADKVKKSMGYSSLYGSFWTSGEANKAYLAIYEVHLGNCMRRKRHDYWMYELTEDLLKEKGNYDSLFARGGADLINNEYIVYNQAQCTIKYLVEIHS